MVLTNRITFPALNAKEETAVRLTAVMQKRGDWYIGFVREIPGINSQGKTLDELRANLKEAARLILEANAELTGRYQGPEAIVEPIEIALEAGN